MPAPAAAAAKLGWDQVAAWRAARHRLEERAPATAMLEVVAGIAGLHAQVMSSAELTLWARVEGPAPAAVRRALWEERSLVKTWAMRGTLHLLPAAEFPLWQAALSTRRLWEAGAWQRGFGVSLAELERLNHAIAQALDGRVLTREELAVRVGELTGSAELGDKLRGSWGALLKPAAAHGLVCFAPGQGQQVGFTRPDTWLGGWESHDPDQAMDEVTRRFLAASGPVTREDFARWWGIPSPAKGAKLLQRLGDEVARVEVEGAAAYALAADLPGLAEAEGSRTVRLLPAFDQYVVTATLQAERLMSGPYKARIYRPQGWLSPVLLVGGRMEGVWRQAVREQAVKGRAVKGRAFKGQEVVKGRWVQVTVEPFTGSLPAWARKAAEAEAERLAAVAGGQLELTWAGA